MRILIALTILGAMAVAPAAAERLDRALSTPGTTQLPDGDALIYRHRRATGLDGGGQTAFEHAIRVERDADKAGVIVTLESGGATRQLASFRGMTGNPILPVFLDSVVSLVSEAVGANPFYLRSRIKQGMRGRMRERPVGAGQGGSDMPAQEIALRPFEGDEHAEEFGVFAALELIFLLSDAAPGGFISLRASAGEATAAYREEIRLDGPD